MYFSLIFSILYIITIAFIIYFVIIDNGDPIKTISWILVLLLFPILGIILYFFFGYNLRRNKFLNRKEVIDNISTSYLNKGVNLKNYEKGYLEIDASDHHTIRLLSNNSYSNITINNKIDILVNGENIYDSIIENLSKAKKHIHLDFFRIQPGRIWDRILKILVEKAKSGVDIKIIYDDVGSWKIKGSYARELRKQGIDMQPFMPVVLHRFANKINHRNHRKIIIIDGEIAYTGGFNIADYYVDGIKNIGKWHDIAIKIQGEAVHYIQKVFLTDWYFVKRQIVNIKDDFFPVLNNFNANIPVQIVKSGPDSDWSTIMQSYFLAITSTKKYLYLSTPYFLPNESILTALKTVALSGRTVKLLIPYKGDSKLVNLATQSYVNELLEAGIEVYLFNDGFNHGKFIIVDGRMCSIGTANIDIRSFDHDFEVNAFIYDNNIAKQMEKIFLNCTETSYKLTLESWNQRTKFNKFLNSFARIMSPMF